jgi:predicted HTH domain antitoxin
LEIPDEVSQAMRLPPDEAKSRLRLELAVSLYAQEILSLGKAAELAGLSRLEFNDALAKRGVPMHFAQEDLSSDLAYARDSQ